MLIFCAIVVLLQSSFTGSETITDLPPEYVEQAIIIAGVQEVDQGKNAILHCHSNDEDHLFEYWELKNNSVVGPSNRFDQVKYNYEILTGNLVIRGIRPEESGVYKCVSRGVKNDNINIKAVHVIVKRDFEELMEKGDAVNHFRIVVLVVSSVALCGGVYYVYNLRRKHRLEHLLEEGFDEEESGDEIFSAPSTSHGIGNIVIDKTRDPDSTRVSMDFEDILKNSQMK